MSFRLNIVDKQLNLSFHVKYQNLARAERPPVVARNSSGDLVREKMVVLKDGQIVQGKMSRLWLDDKGSQYSKNELTFWCDKEQVLENQQTKVMEIEGYQPVENYTDKYVISTYYELFPDTNGMKKDIDRERAKSNNLHQMRKLWEHLHKNNVVARGEFCPSSRGFMASDGYLRAILIDGSKWGVEVGIFKEEKIFGHLEEKIPDKTAPLPLANTGKRLKRI